MKHVICNPLNLEYRYQLKQSPAGAFVYREAADPTMVLFQGTYFLFASMSGGFWYSDDLCSWQFHETPELPVYDYAPDVREVDGAVVFSASRRHEPCTFYRSTNPLTTPFTPVSAPLTFWDPDVFWDDDGRLYFYWGCTNTDPLYGVEMDPHTLLPIGETVALFGENEAQHGWERNGENNRHVEPETEMERIIRAKLGTKPFIEGAYMTKHDGRYYLQYAAPGTQHNVYSDGVYVSDAPLGPFSYQRHNPFSSKPGGFMTGAGHGSTFMDKAGNWWHVSTMRISVTEGFERRIGLFPCNFDANGTMWCNQNFADYPQCLPEGKRTDAARTAPDWMLLSYGKQAAASSAQEGCAPQCAADENCRTYWAAAPEDKKAWYTLDLGEVCAVHAVQLNFADHKLAMPEMDASEFREEDFGARKILIQPQSTRFLLEGSADGIAWHALRDTRAGGSDLPHDWMVWETPQPLRLLRVTDIALPLGGVAAISGLRVFGTAHGTPPTAVTQVQASRENKLNILLQWPAAAGADGYNVRYGLAADQLYSSWQLYGETELDLSMVNGDEPYFIAVDSFNACGVTPGALWHVPVAGEASRAEECSR